ncbi:transposase (plasmid) [Rhizobium sullae]|uniref:Transposase n=2 Tax=Rhizobium sullae TaxID=50338 RepID=A0ABY5XTB2_RHISU|nr:RNA-guided endonuclease TnpB family protein [Rhizobium sullae]UWU17123.1 transposase [Rhizobium sullae]
MAYKFRIYPDGEQARLLRRTIGCCRLVYNTCLEQKRLERHRSDPRRLSAIDQNKQLADLKAELPWLREVPHHCLQQAVIDLHRAYANFFEGRAAYPKPRRKYENESFRYPDAKQIAFREGEILLPKARWVRMVAHREVVGTVKNVTVSLSGDHWYASIQVEREVAEPSVRDGIELGGDLGVVNALALSDGAVYDLPRMSDAEKRREETLARVVSRRKKGSKNRAKAQRDLRNFRARIARRRRDAKHKVTTAVVCRCAVIYLEDLKVKNLTASARGTVEEPGTNVARKAGSNRSMLDVSPGETVRQIECKMRRSGGGVYYVNPAYTSQRCHACGHIEAANRPDRDTFKCLSCGHAACADHNAALNILHLGRKARTGGHPEMACESNPAAGRKQEEDGSSPRANAA